MNVHADKMRMIQVISNLLDNAIKFTSEGDVYVSMKKEAEGDQTSIVVSCKGRRRRYGCGIVNSAFYKICLKV